MVQNFRLPPAIFPAFSHCVRSLIPTSLFFAGLFVALTLQAASPVATDKPDAVPKPPESALVAIPQPGQPFQNSLGMKFVPVGPTKVLFAIWDVRVKDFDAFAATTGYTKIKPKFEQSPTHPVVFVSWDDAQDFCSWLTQKEQQAGRLGKTQVYRLPTDREWSLAAGLDEPDAGTPEEKDKQGRPQKRFPWGYEWPAPKNAGNFDSSTGTDTFLNTSPVGSFAANKYGLYDMGGNVWQWCEDFLNGYSGARVVRGGSYFNGAVENLYVTRRDSYESNIHSGLVGFRVVIADTTGTPF